MTHDILPAVNANIPWRLNELDPQEPDRPKRRGGDGLNRKAFLQSQCVHSIRFCAAVKRKRITAKGFSASILSARARGLVPSNSRSCGRLLRGLVSGPDRSRGVCEFVARTYCRRETGVQSLPFAQSIHCGESGQSPIPTSGGTRIGRGIQSVTFSQPRSQPRQSIRQTVVSTSFRT